MDSVKQGVEKERSQWEAGLSSEVSFWEQWMASKGGRWSDSFQALFEPGRQLPPKFAELINVPAGTVVKLLDVGAGPVSPMAVEWEGRHVVTVAVDPLAHEYTRALKENGLVPLVRTRYGEAERLDQQFAADQFHLVHASNSLDHSYDPMEAIRQMLRVTMPGFYVVLEHAANEAVFQNYDGLHQWNFDVEGGRFIIWRPGVRLVVEEELAGLAQVETTLGTIEGGRRWLSTRIRKSPSDERTRPLRYKVVDQLNGAMKRVEPLHGAVKWVARRVLRAK
jgi:SAM-dependent methyltransferase